MSERDLLTIAEAAHRRGCTVSAIRNAIEDGRLEPYDSPAGEVHVWAAEVDAMDPPRHYNTSSGEPVLTEVEVPGDDTAIRMAFEDDEIRFLSYCLAFTLSRDMLHINQVPIAQRLTRRFDRLTHEQPQGDTP